MGILPRTERPASMGQGLPGPGARLLAHRGQDLGAASVVFSLPLPKTASEGLGVVPRLVQLQRTLGKGHIICFFLRWAF